jgi:hypothetical protein
LPGFKPLESLVSGVNGKWSGRVLWIGLLLFVLALVLRVLFLLTMPDATGPYSPYYKGDTPVWLAYAQALQASLPFDLGIPLRPPGVAYLLALLWDGQDSGIGFLRLTWALLGSAVVALFFLAVLRSFGIRVAAIAALLASASTGLIILSTSLNNEIPYLLLVMAAFTQWEPIRHRPRLHTLLLWSPVLRAGFGVPGLGLGAGSRTARGMETKPWPGPADVGTFSPALNSMAASYLVANRTLQSATTPHQPGHGTGLSAVGAGAGRTALE